MHRKRMTRFLAGILSALLVMTSSGMEQMVFAAEPETEVLQEETVVEADDTETSEEEVEAPEETVDAEDAEEENPEEQPDEAEAEEPSPEETDGDSATDADQTETLPETAEANIQAAQDKTAVTSAESNFTYRKDSGKEQISVCRQRAGRKNSGCNRPWRDRGYGGQCCRTAGHEGSGL